jgi:hypothetical protein
LSKINIRSPYHILIAEPNLNSAKLELFIYEGTQTTDRPVAATYDIESTAYAGELTLEVSELVKDYLEVTFDGIFRSNNVWVDYQVTRTVNDTVMNPDTMVQLVAFDGYGYFEDGVNPTLSSKLLQSNTTVYSLEERPFSLPIQQDQLSSVELLKNGSVVSTQSFTPTSDSNDVVRYVGYANPAECAGTIENYVFQNNPNFIFEDGNNFIFSGVGLDSHIDSVRINYSDASSEVIKINTLEVGKHKPYKLIFVNKFGAFQEIWFFRKSTLKMNLKEESYKANIMRSGGYNTYDHRNRLLDKQGTETLSLNSGYYSEDYNEVFRQLMLSEQVWIDLESDILPVIIESSEFEFKTSVNDKLINYTLDVAYAHDKINNIR